MPKIGTTTVRVMGEYKKFTIFYNRKSGFYLKDLPDNLSNALAQLEGEDAFLNGHTKYPTEQTMLGKFKRALQVYHEKNKDVRKVLRIYMSVGKSITHRPHKDGGWTVLHSHTVVSSDMQYGLGIEYQALGYSFDSAGHEVLHTFNKDGTLGRKYIGSHSHPHFAEIEYTEKAEEAIKEFCQTLHEMSGRFMDFLKTDDFLGLIQKGIAPLSLRTLTDGTN